MKAFITVLLVLFSFSGSILYTQPSKIKIFQNTGRQIESFKKVRISDADNQIYIKFELDYSTSANYSGAIIKYNKNNNNWYSPYNGFLSTICSPDPPGQMCRNIVFFMSSSSDTNYILSYRLSSWSSDPDARTFLSTNAGSSSTMYNQFACGGTMLYPCGGDINSDNSVWFYSYPVLWENGNQYIYRSTNQGNDWFVISEVQDIRTTAPNNNVGLRGGFLKINPFNENYIFAVQRDNLILSTNGGADFYSNNIPPVTEIVFDYSDSTLFSFLDNKIYRSQNNGISWDSSSVSFQFNALEISPDDNSIMYAGTPEGVYRTTNRGANWYLYNNTFTGTKNVIGISKDSGTGDTIIVCTNDEVYKVFRGELSGINSDYVNINDYFLYNNYPNPFNPSTNIKYKTAKLKFITLKIYDVIGNEVAALVNETKSAGNHEIEFSTSGENYNLSSGIYFYSLFADGILIDTKRMVLLK
jgi:hypothetical protein